MEFSHKSLSSPHSHQYCSLPRPSLHLKCPWISSAPANRHTSRHRLYGKQGWSQDLIHIHLAQTSIIPLYHTVTVQHSQKKKGKITVALKNNPWWRKNIWKSLVYTSELVIQYFLVNLRWINEYDKAMFYTITASRKVMIINNVGIIRYAVAELLVPPEMECASLVYHLPKSDTVRTGSDNPFLFTKRPSSST